MKAMVFLKQALSVGISMRMITRMNSRWHIAKINKKYAGFRHVHNKWFRPFNPTQIFDISSTQILNISSTQIFDISSTQIFNISSTQIFNISSNLYTLLTVYTALTASHISLTEFEHKTWVLSIHKKYAHGYGAGLVANFSLEAQVALCSFSAKHRPSTIVLCWINAPGAETHNIPLILSDFNEIHNINSCVIKIQ